MDYLVIIRIQFQSTHPGWGATVSSMADSVGTMYFNPRTPGGVRLEQYAIVALDKKFQSTHPGWGATRG